MRTLLFILGGFLLLAAFVATAQLLSKGNANAARLAVFGFIGVWLAIAAGNMWMGVAKAGYSVAEEFPIFLLIFALPAIAAIIVKWKIL